MYLDYPDCYSVRDSFMFFFFNDTATTEIYTLSLHDALPICLPDRRRRGRLRAGDAARDPRAREDRKSTRLNSSHANISYAVFCLKKKKIKVGTARTEREYENTGVKCSPPDRASSVRVDVTII